MRSIFVASVEHSLQALNRVVSLLRGRNFRIDSLAMAGSERPGMSRLTVVLDESEPRPGRVASCLEKLEEVWSVTEAGADAVRRQAALVKLRESSDMRIWLAALSRSGSVRVADHSGGAVILEFLGSPEEIEAAIGLLPPASIIEVARLPPVAMTRGAEPTTGPKPNDHADMDFAVVRLESE